MPTEGESRNVQSGSTIEETNICKIFKVQDNYINEDNVRFFKPKVLSIGPYHHGSSNLEGMESLKLDCRRYILGPTISESYYDTEEIKELVKKAISSYGENITLMEPKKFGAEMLLLGENITMEPKKFAEMLLLDGCFILAALTGMKGKAAENVSDQTATTLENKAMSIGGEMAAGSDAMKGESVIVDGTSPGESGQRTTSSDTVELEEGGQGHHLRQAIVQDLLLLENQIPFFVLEKIHKLAAGEGETTESLEESLNKIKENIATYVEGVLFHYPRAIEIPEICSKDFHHLLHLCHMFFRPSQEPVKHHRIQTMIQCFPSSDHSHHIANQWHRAMQYREAGVKFRVKHSPTPHSLLDVTFSNGTMEIPHLSIDGKTELIFSNLIMFERVCPHTGKYINAYVTFMSQLLGNADDVELLLQEGIIKILGRKEEILNIFSRLDGLAVFHPDGEDYYLKSTLQSVEAHYRRRLNWWMAWLKSNHLRNPCLAIAAFATSIGLLCTVIQGFFAVFQYFKPQKA